MIIEPKEFVSLIKDFNDPYQQEIEKRDRDIARILSDRKTELHLKDSHIDDLKTNGRYLVSFYDEFLKCKKLSDFKELKSKYDFECNYKLEVALSVFNDDNISF